jgi:hypothetical protein
MPSQFAYPLAGKAVARPRLKHKDTTETDLVTNITSSDLYTFLDPD